MAGTFYIIVLFALIIWALGWKPSGLIVLGGIVLWALFRAAREKKAFLKRQKEEEERQNEEKRQKEKQIYEQGLKEFENKEWEKSKSFMEKVSPNSPDYLNSQWKLEVACKKLEKWEKLIREVELLNNKACELKRELEREIDWACSPRSAMTDDGSSAGILEKQEELEILKSQIMKLLKQAESIYPTGTKEYIEVKKEETKRKK